MNAITYYNGGLLGISEGGFEIFQRHMRQTVLVDALKHFYSDLLHTYMRGKRGMHHTIVSTNLLQDNIITQGGYLPLYQGFQYDHGSSCLDFHVLKSLRLPTPFSPKEY